MSSRDRELVSLEREFKELKDSLIKMGRELAAEQWHTSGTEPSSEDQVNAAVARCKSDIGDKLLEALGAEPRCRECHEDSGHESWCSKSKTHSR